MDRLRSQARSLVEAAGLGLLATAVLYLPPASIAARLDAWVFDLWSHLDPPLPAAEIVIAEADTPAALAHVVELADDAGAKLIVGTLADTPATQLDRLIGPVEISVDALRTRSADSARGGHLWFQHELDGVIRRDVAVRVQGADLPSLPLYAARFVESRALDGGDTSDLLLRWPRADAVPRLSPTPTAAELEGRIVVAGSLIPKHATPFGFVATPEVVAQMLASHLGRYYVRKLAREHRSLGRGAASVRSVSLRHAYHPPADDRPAVSGCARSTGFVCRGIRGARGLVARHRAGRVVAREQLIARRAARESARSHGRVGQRFAERGAARRRRRQAQGSVGALSPTTADAGAVPRDL